MIVPDISLQSQKVSLRIQNNPHTVINNLNYIVRESLFMGRELTLSSIDYIGTSESVVLAFRAIRIFPYVTY